MRVLFLAVLVAACLAASVARADTVTLKDGSVREGTILRQDAEGVTLEVKIGALKGAVLIPRGEIAKIERKPLAEDAVDAEAAALRKDAEGKTGGAAADAWVKLGDFYAGRTGYSNAAQEAFQQAVKAEPEHAAAHARLGHRKTAKGWEAIGDEQRAKGLVELGEVWVKPAERAWLIDRKDADADGLVIGPRKPEADKFTQAEVEKLLKMRAIEAELARRETLRVQHGESFLQRYGYYGDGNGMYIGPGHPPVYADGVGISSGDYEFFVGNVTTYPGYWSGGGHSHHHHGWHGQSGAVYNSNGNAAQQFKKNFGYSPGFVYKNFAFGTNFSSSTPFYSGGWGGYGWGSSSYYSSGFNLNLSGGSKSFKYNIGLGGFSGSSSSSGYSGFGW